MREGFHQERQSGEEPQFRLAFGEEFPAPPDIPAADTTPRPVKEKLSDGKPNAKWEGTNISFAEMETLYQSFKTHYREQKKNQPFLEARNTAFRLAIKPYSSRFENNRDGEDRLAVASELNRRFREEAPPRSRKPKDEGIVERQPLPGDEDEN